MKRSVTLVLATLSMLAASCWGEPAFDPEKLAIGPGGLVGNGDPINSGDFPGGDDALPAPRQVEAPPDDTRPPDCDQGCVDYCNAQNLENPVNRGLCRASGASGSRRCRWTGSRRAGGCSWTCSGRCPRRTRSSARCQGDWGDDGARADGGRRVRLREPAPHRGPVPLQHRGRERRVGLRHRSARREALPGHRAVRPLRRGGERAPGAHAAQRGPGRPGRGALPAVPGPAAVRERARGHGAALRAVATRATTTTRSCVRMPDAYLRFRCLTEDNKEVDPEKQGECTRVLWGYNELIFTPDVRAALDRRSAS